MDGLTKISKVQLESGPDPGNQYLCGTGCASQSAMSFAQSPTETLATTAFASSTQRILLNCKSLETEQITTPRFYMRSLPCQFALRNISQAEHRVTIS